MAEGGWVGGWLGKGRGAASVPELNDSLGHSPPPPPRPHMLAGERGGTLGEASADRLGRQN